MVQPAKIGALAASLTIKAAPVADESLVGYLARIANRNGLENPHWLADSLQDTFSTIDVIATRHVDLTIFSQLTRQSKARLRHMAYWPVSDGRRVNFLGNCIPREMVTVQHRRYCPQCLADEPYHRACWDLSVATACTVHCTKLLTRCPKCDEKVGWVSRSLVHCRCNGNLRRAKAQKLPSNDIVAMNYITERLVSREEPVGLTKLTPGDELELIYVLGSYASSSRRRRPISLLQSGADMLAILNDGHEALADFPASLHGYFAGLRVARRGRYGLAPD